MFDDGTVFLFYLATLLQSHTLSHATCLLPTCCSAILKTKTMQHLQIWPTINILMYLLDRWQLPKTEAKLATDGLSSRFQLPNNSNTCRGKKTGNCRQVCQLAKKCKPTAKQCWAPAKWLGNCLD